MTGFSFSPRTKARPNVQRRPTAVFAMSIDHELLDAGMLVIVGAVYSEQFQWYASPWEMWFLDEWLGNEGTMATLLSELTEDEVTTSELRSALSDLLPARSWKDIEHAAPSLYVDFDSKHLTSVYWECISFESMVPAGWEGEFDITFQQGQFDRFFSKYPMEERYWIIDTHDVFQQLLLRESGPAEPHGG